MQSGKAEGFAIMRIGIVAIGRLKGPEAELCERYRRRIGEIGRAMGISGCRIDEMAEARDRNPDVRKQREAQLLLGRLERKGGGSFMLAALDERGRRFDSQGLADFIRRQNEQGGGDLFFAIGGPDGHGPELLERAGMKISLSPLTMPHGLARVVLLEQVYRALTMIAGHPYHRL